MLDASGKIPEGILTGNLMVVGSYHSCLDVNVLPFNYNGAGIEGFQ